MRIETLSERIANAENKIGKKQRTILKKQELITKKQHLLDTKYLANSDSSEARALKWDIEHYTDDIRRLEREISETTLTLDNYRKQLTGLMERVSVLITDMPDILKGLQEELVERWDDKVWDVLEDVIREHPVMLNRAPTLHRLGIQAFEPVLVEGRAIKLHPLACTAFNADFDGDQMAVHVPLSAEAQAEARMLMLAANNLLKPSDGKPVAVPTQDMVIGSYYLTMIKEGEAGCPREETLENGETITRYNIYRDSDEALMAYQEGSLGLHSECLIRFTKEVDGEVKSKLVKTTVGRVIFNRPVPQDLGFIDRNDPENMFELEVSFVVKKGGLGKIVDRCIRKHGVSIASKMLDELKAQGYKYSTISGTTVAVIDALIPEKKTAYLAEAEEKVERITTSYEWGEMTDEERKDAVIKTWEDCTNKVSDELTGNFDGTHNPIHMMVDSGARGSTSQLRQLAGMRGLIANTSGETVEVPIRANYREGLNILEYFISSRGARKGLTDTALRTADSGYLTRRLVDVSQDVIIRDNDCGCNEGTDVYAIMD